MASKKSVLVAEPVEGFRIEHAYGARRKQAQEYLRRWHYLASDGNQGFMFSITADDNAVAGACLVGNAMSENVELDLLGAPRPTQDSSSTVRGACLVGQSNSPDIEGDLLEQGAVGRVLCQQIKRSHILDDVPVSAVCESKLLRRSIQYVTDYYARPVLFVSYADPSARDSRDHTRPLLGGVYLAAGGYYVGKTGPRKVVLDHDGKWRSTKQGRITLTRHNLPKKGDVFGDELITRDWEIFTAEPALIWVFVCTPSCYTKKQSQAAWRATWRALSPTKRVAAKVWVDEVQWGRDQRAGIVSLGDPKPEHVRDNQRFQPAEWPGDRITRTAAPAWPGYTWQNQIVFEEADIVGETVANRIYLPKPTRPQLPLAA